MNSGEWNKIAGATIGAILVFLLLGFFSEELYSPHYEGEVLAYAVAAPEPGAKSEEAKVDLAGLVAGADPSAGEKVFNKCKSCHKLEDGANAVGPYLWGVVGRPIASAKGYEYDDALKSKEGDWTLQHLFAFLKNPQEWAPGTKMSFSGLPDPKDRVNLIAYLNEADGTPIDLTAGLEGEQQAQVPEPAASTASGEGSDAVEAKGMEAVQPVPESTEPQVTTPETAAGTNTEAQAASGGQAEAASGGQGDMAIFSKVSADDGKKIFRRCQACHSVEEGKNRVGPSLYGVVGRKIASEAGYSYDDALKSLDGKWTPEHLLAFLKNPQEYAPGTKMTFAGLPKEEDRAAVIKYLAEVGGTPLN